MPDVIPIRYSKRKQRALEIKRNNDNIIYELYQEGKARHNPYDRKQVCFEGDVIEVPGSCFKMKQAYKVGT